MAANATNPSEAQPGQWNVQVVRGKVTTRCLWNACKALSIGLFLMTVGATMAIVGYYADHLSVRNEVRGNSTIKIRNESRVFHLNNLSYAGPVIMGVGGFIVVAACVMTFEARDSAAKVVPARFKPSLSSSGQLSTAKSTPRNPRNLQRLESKINSSCQTPAVKGNYKISNLGCGNGSPINDPLGRKMLTSAFVKFSRALLESSPLDGPCQRRTTSETNLNKSPSAPNLYVEESNRYKEESARKTISKTEFKPSKELFRNYTLLTSHLLERQALSIDSAFCDRYGCCTPLSPTLCRQCSEKSRNSHDSLLMELGASAGVSGSQASMALDLHDCQVTLKVKDESQSRRSDTSKKHQLLRQRPVEDEREFPFICSCTTQMIYTNTSDDSVIKRSLNINRAKSRSVSRSRSCTEQDKTIYCIEDHKNWRFPSAEKARSPQKSVNYHIHRRVDTSKCLLHNADSTASRGLVRKNAKRRRSSSQRTEESLSNDDSRETYSKSPTPRSPLASPMMNNSSTNSPELFSSKKIVD